MKKFKKLLAGIMTLCMLATMMPATVLADEPAATEISVTTPEELVEAIEGAGASAVTIKLADGKYKTNVKVPGGTDITITGSKDAVLSGQIATTSSTEGKLTIEGVTYNVADIEDNTGISQTSKSAIAIWGNQTVICENVTFNMSVDNTTAITSWWDTGVGTTIECYNCTFNCNGQRPIRATGNVTVEGCTFNDPYRYAVQLTAKASTATELDKAVVNFNNNTIENGENGKAFVYGIQLEGSDYGCHDLVINGKKNTIKNGGENSTMYFCECGKVDHTSVFWNVEAVPVCAESETDAVAKISYKAGDVYFATLEKALETAKDGDTIILLDDVTLSAKGIAKDITIDLDDNILTVTGDHNLNGNIKIKNGTLDVTSANANGDGIITIGSCNGANATLTLDNVDVKGDVYNSAYAVFYVYTTATLDVNDCTMTLSNEKSSLGGVIKAQTADGVIKITKSELNFTDTVRGIQSGIVTIKDSKVTIKGTEQKEDKLNHAFNSEMGLNLTFDNTEVLISNGFGRGITLNKATDAVKIKGGSVVTIEKMAEGSIMFKAGAGVLTVEDCTYATNPSGCLIVGTVVDNDGENSLDAVKAHFNLPTCFTLEENDDNTDNTFVLKHGKDHEAPVEPTPSTSSSKSSSKKYNVEIEDTDDGTVKASSTRVKKGATVTLTVTPDDGYELDEIIVLDKDGDEVDVTDKGNGKFTFTMPKGGVTVETTFEEAEDEKEPVVEDTDKDASAGEVEEIILTVGQKIAWVFDEYVVNDVAPVIRNDRTMLPIRFVAEALGATVTWDEPTQTVTIVKGDLDIEIYIGQAFAKVNGTPVQLDSPAFIENDRTYLPLRFVAENLGATVTWDADTQKVTIIPGE